MPSAAPANVVLASGNAGKVREIQALLGPEWRVRPQSEFGVVPVEESGETFLANALLKARHAARLTGLPTLADDSGLEVDALGGAPEGTRPAQMLADALTTDGFVASVQPSVAGEQLCQHHCPVAHVAEEFPQMCEAETEMFARLLGTHVQRLATIAHGDGVPTMAFIRPG